MRANIVTTLLLCTALLTGACSGSDDDAVSTTTTAAVTTTTEDFGAYCRVMQRTEQAYKAAEANIDPSTLKALSEAEAQRIEEAPPELQDEYGYWEDGNIPTEVVDRVKDWTQEHCGFLPTF